MKSPSYNPVFFYPSQPYVDYDAVPSTPVSKRATSDPGSNAPVLKRANPDASTDPGPVFFYPSQPYVDYDVDIGVEPNAPVSKRTTSYPGPNAPVLKCATSDLSPVSFYPNAPFLKRAPSEEPVLKRSRALSEFDTGFDSDTESWISEPEPSYMETRDDDFDGRFYEPEIYDLI